MHDAPEHILNVARKTPGNFRRLTGSFRLAGENLRKSSSVPARSVPAKSIPE